jgi:hypothetical protein
MPRFTIYDQTGQETDLTSKLYGDLFDVLRTAGIPEDNGAVNYLHTYVQSRHTSTGVAVFHDEPFVKLTCEYHYIPDILESMVRLKVFPDLEIPLLGSFFILGKDLKNGQWRQYLRKQLRKKSFTARNAGVFLLDNLELFVSTYSMDKKSKKIILRNAFDVIDSLDSTISIGELRRNIVSHDEQFRICFLEALRNDLRHLAILAELS